MREGVVDDQSPKAAEECLGTLHRQVVDERTLGLDHLHAGHPGPSTGQQAMQRVHGLEVARDVVDAAFRGQLLDGPDEGASGASP